MRVTAKLVESIREHGVMQPVLVRPVDDHFELIAGERRWRAAQKAGLQEVPAVIRDIAPSRGPSQALVRAESGRSQENSERPLSARGRPFGRRSR